MRLRFSVRAATDIKAAVSWWRSNRPLAPDMLREELRSAIALLKVQPGVGSLALDVDLRHPGVRRYLLSSSSYFLYYRETPEGLEVLRLWHTSRGGTPKL